MIVAYTPFEFFREEVKEVSKMTKKQKEELISQEYERLINIFKDIDVDKLNIAKSVIQNVAFMKYTLIELQEAINKEGAVINKTNGNGFEVISEHPATKSYSTLINRFNNSISQLINLLPKGQPPIIEEDELLDFINNK